MNFEDNYRIVERGSGDSLRFAVQRRIPARARMFWTTPERWEFVGKFVGAKYRQVICQTQWKTWEEAEDFRDSLIDQDEFNADHWKVCE